ncbi:MAG TPA: CHAT domain-containing protein, partial [Longimicrobium sp.]|nr:CHAT domain-containing protein [Longimicrobium sp.]
MALTKRAAAAHSATLNADTLHAVALSDLIWGRSSDVVLQRVIESLETAARLADRPAPVLADLAAARIERAEHTQRLHDLLEAVEIADSALMLEPRNPTALFNVALGLERLGLDGEADQAWARYLEVDASSGWAHEATRRRRELARPPPQRSLPVDVSPAAVDSLARRTPQEVRELGWEVVLDDWGAAVLRGDTSYAADRLRVAEALGNALVRTGGDGTLAEAVKAIRLITNDDVAMRGLAAAHRAYAAGQRAYLGLDHTRADAEFTRVETLRPPSRTLLLWSSVFRGATLFYLGERERGESLVQGVATAVDEQRAAALAGRARWNLGTMRLRTGRYSSSVPEYRKASRLLTAVGEWENAGAVEYGLGEANFALGDRPASDSILLRGAARLRPYRSSRWLHGLLLVTANVATSSRLRRAAAHVHDEDVRVAARIGLTLYELEARANRARFMAVSGDTAAIARDLVSSRRLLPSVSDPRARGWVENDLRLARSAVLLGSSPEAAIAALDSVAEFLRASANPLVLIPALQARAEASLALRDADGAAPYLDSATVLLGSLNTKVEQTALRVSMLDRGRELFDRLAMLRIAQGRGEEAFAVVERGRVSLSRQGSTASGQAGAPPRARAGETLLSYALVGDTLLVWTIVGDSVHLARSTPGRARLLSTLDRLRTALERHVGTGQVRGDLAALYELLVRPVEGRLGRKVVVVADGEIAGAPFAALFDAHQQRYVVQDHVLRYASSLQDARTSRPLPGADERVLLVADPAFDTRRFDGGRLPNARAEVDSLRPGYPGAEVL